MTLIGQPYIYVCEMAGCVSPASKHDVEDYNYLCNDCFDKVVVGEL